MTRMVYALRHGPVVPRADIPSTSWGLSSEGVVRSRRLAVRPDLDWWSSPEPKAIGTLRAALRHDAFNVDARLRELERGGWVDHYAAHAEDALRTMDAPAVTGWETARSSSQRLEEFLSSRVGSVGISTHGLILTAWLTSRASRPFDAVSFWQGLRFPDLWAVQLSQDGRWTGLQRLESR